MNVKNLIGIPKIVPVPKKFKNRLIFMALIMGLVPILIFGLLLDTFGDNITEESNQIVQQGQDEQWQKNQEILKETIEEILKQRGRDVANQLDMYLLAHPNMTREELQSDPEFRKLSIQPIGDIQDDPETIAVFGQPIGEFGYTAVNEDGSHPDYGGTIYSFVHINPQMEGLCIHDLKDQLGGFFDSYVVSIGGKEAAGAYEWVDADDVMREKFIYIVPLKEESADGARFQVSATAYFERFTLAMEESRTISERITQDMTGTIQEEIESARNTGFLIMGLVMIFILILAYVAGGHITKPIEILHHAAEQLEKGDLNARAEIKTGNEIEQLSNAFNRMASTIQKRERELKEYSKTLEQKVEERTRELAESEEKYRVIFETTGTATVIVEEDTIISLANNEFEKLSGYSKEEINGKKSWTEFVVKKDLERMKEYHKSRRIGPGSAPGNYEFWFIERNGNVKYIFLAIAIIPGTKKSVASLLDITDRKRAEEALKKAMDELKEIDRMKDEFFSSVTHELRNPLTPVRLQSQLLLRRYFGELTEKQKDSVEIILKNTNRIIRLTDDIMTISKMRAGVLKYDMAENNIIDIIEDSVSNMESLAKGKKIAVIKKYPKSLLVKCDKDRINQIIENLIGNAIKFTQENGKITVYAKRIENDIVVSVEDTGIGISRENQEKLFSAFFQVSSRYGGTGLGLAICKNIVESHQGNIKVESKLSKGSKFIFNLPAIQ